MRNPMLQRLWKKQVASQDQLMSPLGLTPLTEPRQTAAVVAPFQEKREDEKTDRAKKYLCREGHEADLEEIAELFRSHKYGPQEANWLHWKYFANPEGRAKIFLGVELNGAIVALRAHTPRFFSSYRTGTFQVMQSVDWFVAKANRGTGVYSQLREFSRLRRELPVIGFPNETSRRITKTFPGDTRVYFPIDEWWYPITLSEGLSVGFKKVIGTTSEDLSRLYTLCWLGKHPKHLRMEPLERFSRDYSLNLDFIHGVRSADYLNWRFVDNPMRRFSIYELLKEDRSIGYCVYDTAASFAKIYDLVLTHHPRGCLRLLVDHFRDRGMSHIIFKSVGFSMRRYGFIKIGSPGDFDTLNTPQGKWLVTFADKD